jgi:hypothetical protein
MQLYGMIVSSYSSIRRLRCVFDSASGGLLEDREGKGREREYERRPVCCHVADMRVPTMTMVAGVMIDAQLCHRNSDLNAALCHFAIAAIALCAVEQLPKLWIRRWCLSGTPASLPRQLIAGPLHFTSFNLPTTAPCLSILPAHIFDFFFLRTLVGDAQYFPELQSLISRL